MIQTTSIFNLKSLRVKSLKTIKIRVTISNLKAQQGFQISSVQRINNLKKLKIIIIQISAKINLMDKQGHKTEVKFKIHSFRGKM